MRASAVRGLPRHLHPGAWWLWALGMATAASRTTNPVLLALLASAVGYVVVARRGDAPWARAYGVFLRIGLLVLVFRLLLSTVFGASVPGHVLVRLPEVPLPAWAAGVRLGGPVTLEGLAGAAYDACRLAVMLCCIGAANALASPTRLLRSLPGALYEMGVAIVVALSFAPQAVVTVARIRSARRLRGRSDRGLAGLAGLARPVLDEALERSLELAASMDSRGYGRRGALSTGRRRVTTALSLGGLLGLAVGSYGLLDAGSPGLLGLPLLALGAALAAASLILGSRRAVRTRYRPDPWRAAEWSVAACGALAAAAFVATGLRWPDALDPSFAPLVVPPVPLVAAGGLLVGLLPAWLTPPAPRLVPQGAAA